MGSGTSRALSFGGRFRVVSLLKSGQGIDTWLGEDAQGGRRVLIKAARASTLPPGSRHRLEHEARVLAQLESPFVASSIHTGQEGGLVFLVFPFVEGITLEERLRRGPLPVEEAVHAGIWLMTALAHVHAHGVLHRDIKPANLIVNEEPELQRLTLIDFGLARSGRIDSSIREQPVGTVRYVAPEQAGLLDAHADERSDLYSAGVVLFECLAGRPPFLGSDITEVLRQHMTARPPELRSLGLGVPRALDEVLQRLLRKDPGDRYHSAEGVLADLTAIGEALARGEPDAAIVIGAGDRRPTVTEPAFIGRGGEVAALIAEVDRARRGHGRLVLLEAESGGGKTRLLEELDQRTWRAAAVLRGQGVAAEAPRPFQMLVGVAEQLMAMGSADPAYAALVRQRLGEQQDAVCAALPELSALFVAGSGGTLGPEAFGEARTVHALASLLDALGTEASPALVILDDGQWADESTLELLRHWQQRRGSQGPQHTCLVVAFRSDEVTEGHGLRRLEGAASLVLAPLSAPDIRRLAESMAGGLPEEALRVVEDLSGGSPFMASAVLRGLVECGALVHEPAPGAAPSRGSLAARRWRVEPLALEDVRSSHRAALLLSRRLERLPPPLLRLLSVGALLGKEFDLDLAATLSGQPPGEAGAALAGVQRRHIVWSRAEGARWTFVHDKLREALLGRMSEEERRALHLRAAEAIEGLGGERSFELAYHYDAAGAPRRALVHALRAGDRARARHALALAEQQYRIAARGGEGSDGATRLRIAEGLGDVLLLRGRYEDAAVELGAARALAEADLDRARLEGKLGDLAFKRGDTRIACEALERGLGLLGRPVPRFGAGFLVRCLWEALVQALHTLLPRLLVGRRSLEGAERELLAMRLHSRLAHAYWFGRGKIPCAWTHLRGLNLAERYPPTAELAQAYSEHAPVMTMLPAFARGITYAEKSLAIRRSLGDVWGQGQSLHFYGVVLYGASRFEACIEKCREAMRLLERTGDRWELNTAAWHVAFSLYRLGRLREAREVARKVHRDGVAIGDAQATGISLGAWSKASGGDVPEELLAAELERHGEDVHTTAEVLQGEALRLLREGRAADAVAALERADALVTARGFRQEYVSPVLPWLATAYRSEAEAVPPYAPGVRRGLLAKAARAARRAVRLARWYRNNLPHALREAAMVAALQGRPRRARRFFRESAAVAAGQDARNERALTLLALGQLGEAQGWPEAADDLAQAQELVDGILAEDSDAFAVPVSGGVTISLAERFDQIVDHGRRIAAALSRQAIAAAVREAGLILLRGERCALLEVRGHGGAPQAIDARDRADAVSRSIVARAIEEARPMVVAEGMEEGPNESALLAGLRSVLCAPVLVRGQAVACFYVTHSRIAGLFGEGEERLAQYITSLAAVAWENAEGLSRAEEAVRVRDEFLAIASHELRTPLTPLQLELDRFERTLRSAGSPNPRLATGLEAMSRQTLRLAKLVETLLDVTRITGGALELELEELDLAELVGEVVERFAAEAKEAGCALTVAGAGPVRGRWDPLRLEQVITNLLTNAVKYGAGKPVEVRLHTTSEAVLVEVQDQGIGLEGQDLARIFARFERAASARQYGGLGLGLYIARQLVEAHGGRITVSSAPGKGATFTVMLPWFARVAVGAAAPAAAPAPPS
jgi:signal transduction histidine kinase